MKKLATTATLILFSLLASISVTKAQTIADWQQTDLDPTELSLLNEELSPGHPRVLEFAFNPYWSGAKLEGCGYNYKVLMKDSTSQSKLPIEVYGSLVYFSPENMTPYLSFRIGLKDIKEHNNSIWERDDAVSYAYLRFGNKSLAGKEFAIASGKDGVKIFKYKDSEKDGLMTWLSIPETLSIRFKRKSKNRELHIDLSVLDHRDAWSGQSGCYRELTELGE